MWREVIFIGKGKEDEEKEEEKEEDTDEEDQDTKESGYHPTHSPYGHLGRRASVSVEALSSSDDCL